MNFAVPTPLKGIHGRLGIPGRRMSSIVRKPSLPAFAILAWLIAMAIGLGEARADFESAKAERSGQATAYVDVGTVGLGID